MKILIIQNKILHYRKSLYNFLSLHYNVTVLHSGKQSVNNDDKYVEIIIPVHQIKTFYFQKGILNILRNNNYDVVITMGDLHWIYNLIGLFIKNKNTKFIFWGSWFTNKYFIDKIKVILAKIADANIFYSYVEKERFEKKDVNKNKLFVSNNTFDVGKRVKSYESEIKNNLLFVGSFDKRKQLDVLIRSFKKMEQAINSDIKLILIGDGTEKRFIISLINELNLLNKVILPGRINNPQKLKNYYYKSIASVSFGQAGLSVLQSLGFGVPFITKKEAISGGEITNIKHGKNGLFCDDDIQSLYNELAKYYVNTVVHSGVKSVTKKDNYTEIITNSFSV